MPFRLRATVEYDGTDFEGFQRQAAGHRSVQEVLERALSQVTQQSVGVLASGRTDAGVHATGQVIAFGVDWAHPLEALQRAINAVLPADVAVQELRPVPADFHPRFSARSRVYQYTITNRPVRSPLARRWAWHVVEPLDGEAMAEASRALVGEHDFATFGQPPQGESTVRRVVRAEWHRTGDHLVFEIEANAFLYRMVRSLVGTLREVGARSRTPQDFRAILAAADRRLAGQTAPAHGLCLVAVNYDEE